MSYDEFSFSSSFGRLPLFAFIVDYSFVFTII